MKNRKALLALAAALAVGLGTTAIIGGNEILSLNGVDSTYTLTLSSSSGQITTTNGYADGTVSATTSPLGNSVSFSYVSGLNASGYQGQYKASIGYIYSTTGIKGLSNVNVTFDSSSKMSLYTSNTDDFSSSTATTITSGTDYPVSQNYFKILCGSSYSKVTSIVLTYTCNGSAASSAASSSQSSSSSTPVSSSSASTGTVYSLVTSASDLAAGRKYLIGAKSSGSGVNFLSTAVKTSSGVNYLSPATADIVDSQVTLDSASSVVPLTLGGSSGAYTFVNDSKYLSGASSGGALTFDSSASTYSYWTIDLTSSAATITNNGTTGRTITYNTTYQDFGNNNATSTVYLFVERADPSLTLSSTTLSLAAGSTDTTIIVTASNFSATPSYAVNSNNESVATGSVSGSTLSVSAVASGSATFTITATSGSESASATLSVFVTSASGAYVTIDNSSLTLYKGRASGSVQATAYSFSGTVTYSASSSDSSIASVSINSSTGAATVSPVAVGSAEITFTASNGSESSSAICNVSVETAPTATLALDPTTLSLYASGSAGQITATASGFTSPTYTASSSNTSAATVSMTGTLALVTPVAQGSATITITAKDTYSTKTATCAVTVAAQAAGTTTQYTYYRVAPQYAGSSATTSTYYTVAYSNGMYRVTATHTLTKNSEYTTYDDVAAYYQAFKGYPSNYVAKNSCQYTGNQRCISTYTKTSNTGYLTNINAIRNGSSYIELDIATAGSTSYSSSSTRGVIRVVVFPDGFSDYGSAPVLLYTSDHYAIFVEYGNSYGNWGKQFAGENSSLKNSRSNMDTVLYALS
jgi:uncharacterized protein YjdB